MQLRVLESLCRVCRMLFNEQLTDPVGCAERLRMLLLVAAESDLSRSIGRSYQEICSPNNTDSHKAVIAVRYILERIVEEHDRKFLERVSLFLADCNWFAIAEPMLICNEIAETLRVRVVPGSWQDESCMKALARMIEKQREVYPTDIVVARESVSAKYPLVWLDAAWRSKMGGDEFLRHIRRLVAIAAIDEVEFKDCVAEWSRNNRFVEHSALSAWEGANGRAGQRAARHPGTRLEVNALDDSKNAIEQINAGWRTPAGG
jgi:hypothetical protein